MLYLPLQNSPPLFFLQFNSCSPNFYVSQHIFCTLWHKTCMHRRGTEGRAPTNSSAKKGGKWRGMLVHTHTPRHSGTFCVFDHHACAEINMCTFFFFLNQELCTCDIYIYKFLQVQIAFSDKVPFPGLKYFISSLNLPRCNLEGCPYWMQKGGGGGPAGSTLVILTKTSNIKWNMSR